MENYKILENEVLESAKLVRQSSKSGGSTKKEEEIKMKIEKRRKETNRRIEDLFEKTSSSSDPNQFASNFFELINDGKKFIQKKLKKLEKLAEEPLPDLQSKIEDFQKKLLNLENWIQNHNEKNPNDIIRLDWKIRYAAERDPEGKVEFSGGIIKDRFGNPIWLVSCYSCGIEIEHGIKGSGTKRMIDEECSNISFCQNCFFLKKCFENFLEKKMNCSVGQIENISKKYGDKHWTHKYIEETKHAVWLHIDILENSKTPAQFINNALKVYKNRRCIGERNSKEKDGYKWLTYQEIHQRSKKLSLGLSSLLKSKQNFIGICSKNRFEWIISDFACSFSSNIVIGLHITYSNEELRNIINSTKMNLIFTDNEKIKAFVEISKSCPCLKFIINMDDFENNENCKKNENLIFKTLKEVENLKNENQELDLNFTPKEKKENYKNAPIDLFTIIFTSGSTGQPKGVMISSDTFLRDISHSLYIFPLVTPSFIPLSHSTDRMRIWETIGNGGRVGFCSYNPKNWEHHESGEKKQHFLEEGNSIQSTNGVEELILDVQILKPSIFIAPSRIWTGIYNLYFQKLKLNFSHSKVLKKETIDEILEREENFKILESEKNQNQKEKEGKKYNQKEKEEKECEKEEKDEKKEKEKEITKEEKMTKEEKEEKEILEKTRKEIKNLLGDRIQSLATGGSPTSKKVIDLIKRIFEDVGFSESYGCTEVGGIFMNNEVMENVLVKIDEKTKEILVKTPFMFSGYFNLEEETSKSLENNFFFTGDLGFFKNEKLFLIGRKKNVLKTSENKEYDPEEIETIFSSIPCIDQICIIGNEKHPKLIAIIVPSQSFSKNFLKEQKKENYLSLSKNIEFKEKILKILNDFGKKEKLENFKIPFDIIIEMNEWTMENGMITTSFKIVRNRIYLKYQEEIEKIFH